jgi:DAK2 domain fusion protein YloV
MAMTSLDGPAFEKFVAAGTYFLRKYQGVLNDLNVFPVPDGDTGANMYLTARAAMRAARPVRRGPLSAVASAAAQGSLLGARGNSGVILAQMLQGFAHNVRHRDAIDTFGLAVALKDAVAAARGALTKPVEGTIISVAQSAADEAYRLALHEPDFYRLTAALVRAANDALERTPEQLPVLKAAGVVDSGGAGLCYFLEGALRFLPETTVRTTAFPRRPVRSRVFTQRQQVGLHRYCTEFVLEDAALEVHPLRELLEPYGDSLIVAGAAPSIKVHLHAAHPDEVQALAAKYGRLTRIKVEDMAEQHRLLVVDAPEKPFSVVAVVPGAGFQRIARELGAEVTLPLDGPAPSVADLLLAVNSALAARVYLLPNSPQVALAAREAAALAAKTVTVVPARDIVAGLAALLALGNTVEPGPDDLSAVLAGVRSAPVARSEAPLGDALVRTVAALGGAGGGLVTLYYGGGQKERDAQRHAAALGERFPAVSVEYYYGGQHNAEYWVSLES